MQTAPRCSAETIEAYLAEYAVSPDSTSAFDADGNDTVDSDTDGLLINRYLFGYREDALIKSAVGTDCTRCTTEEIEDYLQDSTAFDVDGNKAVDGGTDGILIDRYLSGYRGDALIKGVVGANCIRCTAEAVEAYLAIHAELPDDTKTFTNSLGMTFRRIPAGTFMMGSPEDEPERSIYETLHQVTLTQDFYIQTTEVTQGQWKAVTEENPSYFSSCGDDCPVEQVSRDDVQSFISKLNNMLEDTYRLPTEAEWEYAARAGTDTTFYFGQCLSTDKANYNGSYRLEGCFEGVYRGKTIQVASFTPNSWGMYDMHGNVWEWCYDRYEGYPSGAVTDPMGSKTGSYRVFRGGGWNSYARDCRSAYRNYDWPNYRSNNLGFRLVLSTVSR